jgi:hypothetical protein
MTTKDRNPNVLKAPERVPGFPVPVPNLATREITLEERIRLNGGGGITREQALAVGYDRAEIDRLLPAATENGCGNG